MELMAIFITAFIVFVLLFANEVWWRKAKTHNEVARKFIHISVGSFVAFWPFFLSWQEIRFLSLAFLAGVIISKYLHVFRAIHSVQRPTLGEIFFAAAVGLSTFVTDNKWIYMTAILQMSLADGLAAVIGSRYGRAHRYLIFNQHKSIVGTITFAVVSLVTVVAFTYLNGTYISPIIIASIVLVATILENVGGYGSDNLLVPLFIAAMLSLII